MEVLYKVAITILTEIVVIFLTLFITKIFQPLFDQLNIKPKHLKYVIISFVFFTIAVSTIAVYTQIRIDEEPPQQVATLSPQEITQPLLLTPEEPDDHTSIANAESEPSSIPDTFEPSPATDYCSYSFKRNDKYRW